jgi:vacuolar-type H+-ATPase subunit I/STV1
MSIQTKEEKVFQLVQELEEVNKNKKATAKSYRDECKRIKDEITELIESEDEVVEDNQ